MDLRHATTVLFVAKRGAKRTFASQSDATAYDFGVHCFEQRPRFRKPEFNTPAWHGWNDAEQAQADLNEARAMLARGAMA